MIEALHWLVPLAALAIVALFGFVGCVGDSPEVAAQKAREETAAKDAAAQQAQQQEELYERVILRDPWLVSYWRLSEGDTGSAVAPDSNNQGMNGSYHLEGVARSVEGALFVPEHEDKAAQFDGIRGYMEVPYSQLLNPPQDFSAEFWLHPDETPTAPQAVIAAYEVDANGVMLRGYAVDVVPPPSGVTDFQARVRVGNGTPGSAPAALDVTLGDGLDYGGWFHVVVTYSSINKELNVYVNAIDGKPRASKGPSTGAPVYLIQNGSAPLRVGAGWSDQAAAAPVVGRFFKGRVDEVALYRADLDGTAIENHFLRGTSLPT